jgi:hypothetical protein
MSLLKPSGTWQETRLWAELSSRCQEPAGSLKLILSDLLPKVETILSSGGSPSNFTLHDAGHSWRVAERMSDIAGVELLSQMGPHDLSMLLLSAYLHDIGMTPPLAKVEDHLTYVITGDSTALSDYERDEVQAWLDDEWDGMVPPIAGGTPAPNDLQRAQQIVAGYIRHRHNDWGAQWIEDNLSSYAGKEYPAWLSDVITLCRSHHFSADQLKGTAFDPQLVGSPASVLHLRFCACLLRVADVLDFDPERTPRILYAHRSVQGDSAIFWHKDHELAFVQEGSALSIHAQPPDAVTHYAVKQTVADVDDELLVARRLADETQFHRMAGRSADLPHKWNLETSVHTRIVPRNGAYDYIDGTFRPDPAKLLELVGGVELYGSPLAAIRELLQNAFDAVRDQIARQRLRQDEPASSEVRDHIARTHSVSLSLEMCEEGLKLICSDTGSGMSSDIIKSRFLVGGRPANHEMRALERTCKEHGFSTGKTARFGIGVLSYFLIASKMEIQTRRSIEADDPDGTGWTFSSTGLDDFGELKQAPGAQVGTEVELILKPEIVGDSPNDFARTIRKYLDGLVRYVPCRFTYATPGLSCPPLSVNLGWAAREPHVTELFLNPLIRQPNYQGSTPSELISIEARENRERSLESWRDRRSKLLKALTIDIHRGAMPEGLGNFRIYLGYFNLGRYSLATFLDLEESSAKGLILDTSLGRHALSPRGDVFMSWNGMSVETDRGQGLSRGITYSRNVIVEIDWCSDAAGRLAVDRNSFKLSAVARKALEFVNAKVGTIINEFISEHSDSPLALFNARALFSKSFSSLAACWPMPVDPEEPGKFLVEPLKPPLADDNAFQDCEPATLKWRDGTLQLIPPMSTSAESYGGAEISWHASQLPPTHVGVIGQKKSLRLVPVWDSINLDQPAESWAGGAVTKFPPGWATLAGLVASASRQQWITAWNEAHPLVRACDKNSMEWATSTFASSRDPISHYDELMQSAERVAAWMVVCLRYSDKEIWNGLMDRAEGFLPEAWDLVDGLSDAEEIIQWHWYSTATLTVLSRTRWETYSAKDAPEAFDRLQPPDDEWWISYEDGGRELRIKPSPYRNL